MFCTPFSLASPSGTPIIRIKFSSFLLLLFLLATLFFIEGYLLYRILWYINKNQHCPHLKKKSFSSFSVLLQWFPLLSLPLHCTDKFGKVTEYKINLWKSFVFLYTNTKLSKIIKRTIPFIIASKRIKYLGINLIKEVKSSTQKTIRYWWEKLRQHRQIRNYRENGLGEINIFKMTIPLKAIYRFNAIHIWIWMVFFTDIKQNIIKFLRKNKGSR